MSEMFFVDVTEAADVDKVMMEWCVCVQLAEAVADNDDLTRQTANLRRKLQRGGQDMADLRLHLEEQVGRNAELEKKQRK